MVPFPVPGKTEILAAETRIEIVTFCGLGRVELYSEVSGNYINYINS